MPMTVPTVEPTVQGAQLPGVSISSAASPELLTSSATKVAAAGKAATTAGEQMLNAAKQMKEREDVDQTFAALNEIRSAYVPVHQAARESQGENAKGITQKAGEWWDQNTEAAAEKLTSPEQRRAFTKQAASAKLSSMEALSYHEGEQRRISVVNNVTKSFALNNQAAVAAVNSPVQDAAIDKARKDNLIQLEVLNATMGWNGGPQYEAAKMAASTDLHKQVLQQLQLDNPAAAADYFNKHKDEIDPTLHAEIGKQAKLSSATAIGGTAATDVWAEMGPKGSKDAINMFDMEEAVRKKLKGNDAAIDSAIKGLRERNQAFKDQRTEQGHAVSAAVSDLILNGVSGAKLRADPKFIALQAADDKMALAMFNQAESLANQRLARANALEARADAAEARKERMLARSMNAAYFEYSNPDVIASMSRNAIASLLPVIGADHTARLLSQKDSYEKSADSLANARLSEETFRTLAINSGMDPNKKGLTEDEKDRFSQIKDAISMRLSEARKEKGRSLTDEERRKIGQEAFDNKVRTPGFLFNLGPSSEVPVSGVLPREQGDTYVDVSVQQGRSMGTERVQLSSIPKTFRNEAMAQLRKAGKPTTEQNIAHTWVLNRDAWKKEQK